MFVDRVKVVVAVPDTVNFSLVCEFCASAVIALKPIRSMMSPEDGDYVMVIKVPAESTV